MRDLHLTDLTPKMAPLAPPLLGRALPGLAPEAWCKHVSERAEASAKNPDVPPILAMRDARGVVLAIADLSVEKNLNNENCLRAILYVGHDLLRITREEAGALIGRHVSDLAKRLGCQALRLGVEVSQDQRVADSLGHLLATPTATCHPATAVLLPLKLNSDSVTQLPQARRHRT